VTVRGTGMPTNHTRARSWSANTESSACRRRHTVSAREAASARGASYLLGSVHTQSGIREVEPRKRARRLKIGSGAGAYAARGLPCRIAVPVEGNPGRLILIDLTFLEGGTDEVAL
jgi:hypothetical protein